MNFGSSRILISSALIYKAENIHNIVNHSFTCQAFDLEGSLNQRIVNELYPLLCTEDSIEKQYRIYNLDRAVGSTLSHYYTRFKKDSKRRPNLVLKFTGSAGQSFGAFACENMTLQLTGEANDYFGKGLSGGTLIIKKHNDATFKAHENSIIGNVALYGATSGNAFINGQAGERFCVRNSGADVVVEGIGAHGCEYMTGGSVIILGNIGRNFAAGMSGGIAYVLNNNDITQLINTELVLIEALTAEDILFVKSQLQAHSKHTQSELASSVINQWNKHLPKWIKIIPTEYKKAIELKAVQSKDIILQTH